MKYLKTVREIEGHVIPGYAGPFPYVTATEGDDGELVEGREIQVEEILEFLATAGVNEVEVIDRDSAPPAILTLQGEELVRSLVEAAAAAVQATQAEANRVVPSGLILP
jgi:hypothetical protein